MPPSSAPASDRLALVERDLEEVLTRGELAALLASDVPARHYIGFEISGRIHVGTGLLCMAKLRDFQRAGIETTVFLADWHTWINDKLGGDPAAIRELAMGYFAEGLKASMLCVGGDPEVVRFLLGSDLYRECEDYWATVVEVGKHTSLARMQRSISIMGREEGEAVDFSKLIYPAMQVADIFTLGVNLAHAGMDQRKAHVIARNVALQLQRNPLVGPDGRKAKPIALHHPLLLGLGKPPVWPIPPDGNLRDLRTAMKMSKSKPSSAIFIHDSPDEIRSKVRKAFCPPGVVEFNPILDWTRQLLFGVFDEPLGVPRSEQHGGPVTFHAYEELEEAYRQGRLHPMDLKGAVADRLVEVLEPARRHFDDPARADALARLDGALRQPEARS
jgi:tyrosyl-tRNA synthetase